MKAIFLILCDREERILQELNALPEINGAYPVCGAFDIALAADVNDVASYQTNLKESIEGIKAVTALMPKNRSKVEV